MSHNSRFAIVMAVAIAGLAASAGPGWAAPQASGGDRAEAYHQFLLGRLLNGRGETEGALAAYRRAAELDPTSAEIHGELAELYAQQARLQDAIEAAEAALEIDEDSIQAHWVLGNIYAAFAEQGGPRVTLGGTTEATARRAIDHLERARRPPVYNPGLELRLGSLYVLIDEHDEAIATLEPLAERAAESREVALALADAYAGVGRVDDAIDGLERFLVRRPFSRGLARLARLFESEDRWQDAVGAYRRALEQRPDSQSLRIRLARALLNDGRAAGAAAELRTVLDDSPEQSSALFLLARTELELRNFQAAEAAAERLRELEPNELRGVHLLADVFRRQRQPQRIVDLVGPMVDALRRDADRVPDRVTLLTRLGFAELDLARHERAIAAFEEARLAAPPNATLEAYVIQAYLEAGRAAEALDVAQEAAERFDDELRLVQLHARALQATGEVDAGIVLMSRALERHGGQPSAHLALAGLYAEANRFDAATRVLEDAGEAFPEDISVRFQLGAMLEQQQRFAEAEEAFLGVLRRDPAHAPTLNYLGYMLAELGERLDDSVDYIRRALELDPANGSYLDSLGWAYFKMRRYDEAAANLERAGRQELTNSVIQDHLGQVLFELGRYREAADAWQRALDGDGDSIDRAVIQERQRIARERARQHEK